MNEWTMDEPAS